MIDFKTISWEDLILSCEGGRLGPHTSCELALIVAGRKPAALVTSHEAEDIRKCGLVDLLETREITGWGLSVVVFRKGEEVNCQRVIDAFSLRKEPNLYKMKIEPTYDITLGRALGYSEADIAWFLFHNLQQEQFESWQKS